MKILHIGIGTHMPALAKEISKLGESLFFDWTAYIEMGLKQQMDSDLAHISEEFNPDITFIHAQRPGIIDENNVHSLRGFIINYTYDVIQPIPNWFKEIGKHINLTLFCNENDVKTFIMEGMNSEFMFVGYDSEIFKPETELIPSSKYGEIVFLGNDYNDDQGFPMTEYRRNMIDFLKNEYGDRFKVYGNGWKYNDGNFMFREHKEAECYKECKIAISLSNFELDRYTSDRMFRIMGSGAFCLTKHYPGIFQDFEDGNHLKIWNDFSELKHKINFYLEHDEFRNDIAKKGQEYVSNNFTWKHIAKRIVEYARKSQ